MIPAYGVRAWWWWGGQILGFSIDLHRRPYNTLALPCECVIGGWYTVLKYCYIYSPQVAGTYKWPYALASIAKTVLL